VSDRTPQPVLPVSVLIGGQPATVEFTESARRNFRRDAAQSADSIERFVGEIPISVPSEGRQPERRDGVGAMMSYRWTILFGCLLLAPSAWGREPGNGTVTDTSSVAYIDTYNTTSVTQQVTTYQVD